MRPSLKNARTAGMRALACLAIIAWSSRAAPENNPTPGWTDDVAERVYQAWQSGKPMPLLSVARPDATLAEAYLVQKGFVARMLQTEAIGGFKAAGVGSAGPDLPLTAVMPARGILPAKAGIVVELSGDPRRHVETEIGYIFDREIRVPPEDVGKLRECVKAVAPIIELPGGAVEESAPSTTNDIVAWNINAKAMIVGAPKAPDAVDPDAVEIRLTRDGKPVNEAKGGMAADGQWNTLLKTVNNVLRQGYTIQPGHVITNGALGKITRAEPGRYEADFGSLGVITFEVHP